jgi:ABC-type glutathione transport system ATPase component
MSQPPFAARSGSTEPVLEISGVGVSFRTWDADVEAVKGVSLSVRAGECLGVVGESGSGKSQTFLAAMGLLAANGRTSGSIRFEGRELLGLSGRELNLIRGSKIGMIFQDPLTALTPHMKVGRQIAEGLEAHLGLTSREARARALEWLERVRIAEPARRMNQYPHELSGGMRQRVMIASAMACSPVLLIADEPTTALDVTVQAEILDLMAELKLQTKTAMVLISHDMGVVARLADRVLVMREGQVVEEGEAEQIFTRPRSDYARALLQAAAGVEAKGDLARQALDPVKSDAAVVVEARDLKVWFPVRRGLFEPPVQTRAVDGVSFAVREGETLGVVGESGSGKTTLSRAVMRLLPPSSGAVTLLSRDITHLEAAGLRAQRKDLQMVFQDPLASLDPRMTIGDSIAEPLRALRPDVGREDRDAQVLQMMARTGLGANLVNRYPHEMSGGQNQRAGIARAMILKPRLVVCDEAVSALDAQVRAQIIGLLVELQKDFGVALIFVSHDLGVIRQLCHRVMVLYRGRVMEMATNEQIFDDPRHPYTRALLAAVPTPDPARERRRVRERPAAPAVGKDGPYRLVDIGDGHLVAEMAASDTASPLRVEPPAPLA